MNTIIGVGNALTDVLAVLENDDILMELNLPKGGMVHIDEETLRRVQAFFQQTRTHVSTGGSVANSVRALARLGVPTGFIGKVGNDEFGGFYRESLVKRGIDNHLIVSSTLPSGVCSAFISPDGERTFADYMGASLALVADDLQPSVLQPYQYLFLEGYLVQNHDLIARAATLAKQLGLKIVMDMASYNIVKSDYQFFTSLVKQNVDIIFANEEEARAFTGLEPEKALDELARYCGIVVVKEGAQGSYIRRGTEKVHVEAVPVSRVVDTTGAGDSFAAGFLYGLVSGLSLKQSGMIGSVLSSECIQVLGTELPDEAWDRIQTEIATIQEKE